MKLEGRVALITGGGTGIGAAIAKRFVDEGARVCITGRRLEKLEEVVDSLPSGTAVAYPGSITDPGEAERMVAEALRLTGRFDLLVNNAGVNSVGAVADLDPEGWRETIEINLTGAFLMMRAAIPKMIEAGGGSIVNIASVGGIRCIPEGAAYCASKAGLIMLSRQVALDYGPRGIRSNAVCPGWVHTPMSDLEMDELASQIGTDRKGAFAKVVEEVPLRRVAKPEEIAGACVYLASEDSSFMTGAVLVIDGGSAVVDVGTMAFRADTAQV
jgi:NAD(P)-dependent dehydrogenase (short-subunit alcohol dehydrogenase family)